MHKSNEIILQPKYAISDSQLGMWFTESLEEALQYKKDYDGIYDHACTVWQRYEPNLKELETNTQTEHDPVNHPTHYTLHPSGVECIQITEHMNFCLGNAVKYLWRSDLKNAQIEDLKKAVWYIQREIKRLEELQGV